MTATVRPDHPAVARLNATQPIPAGTALEAARTAAVIDLTAVLTALRASKEQHSA